MLIYAPLAVSLLPQCLWICHNLCYGHMAMPSYGNYMAVMAPMAVMPLTMAVMPKAMAMPWLRPLVI